MVDKLFSKPAVYHLFTGCISFRQVLSYTSFVVDFAISFRASLIDKDNICLSHLELK
jgi:hypothetical protein